MTQRLLELVDAYLSDVQRAIVALRAGGIEPPSSQTAWATAAIPHVGPLTEEASYTKHGFGCTVTLSDGEVDFDFGAGGETNRFDGWRLYRYASARAERFGDVSLDAICRWLEQERGRGVFALEPAGSLYYRPHDV
jgi:hypothetical protein